MPVKQSQINAEVKALIDEIGALYDIVNEPAKKLEKKKELLKKYLKEAITRDGLTVKGKAYEITLTRGPFVIPDTEKIIQMIGLAEYENCKKDVGRTTLQITKKKGM